MPAEGGEHLVAPVDQFREFGVGPSNDEGAVLGVVDLSQAPVEEAIALPAPSRPAIQRLKGRTRQKAALRPWMRLPPNLPPIPLHPMKLGGQDQERKWFRGEASSNSCSSRVRSMRQ